MTPLTPEQSRIVENGKALKKQLEQQWDARASTHLNVADFMLVLNSLSLLDELAGRGETDKSAENLSRGQIEHYCDVFKDCIRDQSRIQITIDNWFPAIDRLRDLALEGLSARSNQGAKTDATFPKA